jgi:hypothetical protein
VNGLSRAFLHNGLKKTTSTTMLSTAASIVNSFPHGRHFVGIGRRHVHRLGVVVEFADVLM